MTSQAVEALQKIHIEVEKVINGMNQSDWELQSLCEGWRVQEVFAHMSSNMKEAINPTPPPETPQEPMKAEEAMEALVAPRRDWTAKSYLTSTQNISTTGLDGSGLYKKNRQPPWRFH